MKATVVEKNGLDQVLTRMSHRMCLANYAESTIVSYCRSVRTLGTKIGKSLSNVEEDELHEYLLSLKEGMSQSSWHTVLYGIKYCYVEVLEMPELVNTLPKSRREQSLPVVLNQSELGKIFGACRSLKHRCMFKLAYGTGVRMNELRLLKVADVDSERMRLRVVQGKGRKDRDVVLPGSVLAELRSYYRGTRPQTYLFNGQHKGHPMARRSIQHALKQVLKRSAIRKSVSMHSFRHSFAVHALEMGMDIVTLQHILGHAHLSTTLVYLKVAEAPQSNWFSPLDLWAH